MHRILLALVFLALASHSTCEPVRQTPIVVGLRRARLPPERRHRALLAESIQKDGFVRRVTTWGERHATAAWYPWALALIGFLDPFTLCGFLITPLLTLALLAADLRRALVLCTAVSGGCLAGNACFCALIGRLGIAAKLANSPQLATARSLLQRHGLLAAVMNTVLPAPTIPLMVAAHVLDPTNVPAIILALALGRAIRYVLLVSTVFGSRRAAALAAGAVAEKDDA